MSLTSILSSKEHQVLRDRFKDDFPNPGLKMNVEIKAPPLTENWSVVGTAFDYLLRFYVEHHNEISSTWRLRWVADRSFNPDYALDHVHFAESPGIFIVSQVLTNHFFDAHT